MKRLSLIASLVLVMASSTSWAQTPIAELKRDTPVSFEDEVLPILRRNCLACHSASEGYGDLVLESPAQMIKGGDTGPAIVPGKGAESLLLRVAAHLDEPVMPPPDNDVAAGNLTSAELGLIKLWIDQGARSTGIAGLFTPQNWRPLPPGPNPIYTVAVTADGQFAACGRANQIFIYHVPTGRLVTRLTDPDLQARVGDGRPGIAHLDVIQSLAFSPDGNRLASGGFRTAKIWRYPRNVQQHQLASTDTVTAVAVDPNRQWIATGGADFAIRLWNAESGEAGVVLEGHTATVTDLVFARDGKRLFSSSEDGSIRVWDTTSGTQLGSILAPEPVAALATVFRPAEPAEAGEAGEPTAASDEPSAAAAPEGAAEESPSDVEFQEVLGEEMLVSARGNFLQLWNLTGAASRTLPDTPQAATLMAVSANRQFVAIANAKGTVEVRTVDGNEVVGIVESGRDDLLALALTVLPAPGAAADADAAAADAVEPKANAVAEPTVWIALATTAGVVEVWDATAKQRIAQLRGSLEAVGSVAFRDGGRTLATGNKVGQISQWALDDVRLATRPLFGSRSPAGEDAAAPPAAEEPVAVIDASKVTVSRDGRFVATAEPVGGKPAIVVRELATGRQVATLLGHQAPILSVEFNGDATRLVSGSEDGTARVWDLADAKFPEIARFEGHEAAVSAVALSGDSLRVLSGAEDGSLQLWTVADPTEVVSLAGHSGAIRGVAMLQGTQPVSASLDKTVRIWNPADGKIVRTITETVAVTALALSQDSARLAVAAGNETKIYQSSDGKLLATLAGLGGAADHVAFNADGSRVVSVRSGGAEGGGEAAVHQAADGRLLQRVVSDAALRCGTVNATGDELYLSEDAGGLRVRPLLFERAWGELTQEATNLLYSHDGQVLYAASAQGTVAAFNLENGSQVFSASHGGSVSALALSPDGQTLATGGPAEVKLFNAANGAAVAPNQLTLAAGPVRQLAFTPDGKYVVAATEAAAEGTPHQLTVFSRADGVIEQVLSGAVRADQVAVVGEDAAQILALTAEGSVQSFPIAIRNRFAGHTQPVTSLATVKVPSPADDAAAPSVAPVTLQVLSGSQDGTVRHWDLAAETPQLRQMNHGAPVTAVAAHGEAGRFASTSDNHTVRLWDSSNGQQLAEMKGDLEARKLVATMNLRKTDWTAKVAAATTQLEAATKEVPVKQEAEKTAATALAAAEGEVATKLAAYTTANGTKVAAEKEAIEAAAAAQAAALELREVNQKALLLAARIERMNERASQAQAIAQNNPGNEQLATIAEEATAELAELRTQAEAAEAAKKAPTEKADATAKAADAAAQKVVQMTPPFTQAATELEAARATLASAKQSHELAVRDLDLAKLAVTDGEKQLAAAQATLQTVEQELAKAIEAETATNQPLRAVAFAPDGRTLATGGDLGVVHTWSSEAGQAVASYVGHEGPIQTLAFLSAADLVSAGTDKQAILWNINPQWELERTIGDFNDPTTFVDRVAAVDFSHDGRLLATGGGVPSRNGEVKIWNVEDGALVHDLVDAHADAVNDVAFSPDDAYLASASSDKLIRKWDVESGEMATQFEGHTEHVLSVDWRANGQLLASSGGDARIRIWNATTGDRIREIQGYTKQVTDLCFVGQTQFVLATSGDPIVRMHNSDNGATQRNFAGAEDYMYAIDATPDSNVVVAGGHDGVLRVWNGNNGQVIHALDSPGGDEKKEEEQQ